MNLPNLPNPSFTRWSRSLGLTLALGVWAGSVSTACARLNVLFISVDDLRPELGCYGAAHIKSPNIDRLARQGAIFERAYCQQALCNPSRTSLLTGLRPDTIGVTGNHVHFRKTRPDVVTLPQHFKNNGYHAQSFGKVYHGPFLPGAAARGDIFDDELSWSVPPFKPGPRYYYTPEGIAQAKEAYRQTYRVKEPAVDEWTKKLVFGPMTEAPDVADDVLYDGQVARKAVAALRRLGTGDKPFFLAVGFIKPHTPFVAPKKYWDLYRPEDIRLAQNEYFPTNAPKIAGHNSGEVRRYTDQPKRGPFTKANKLRLRHGYYACISYIDAQIGLLLDELDRTGLREKTVIVLYGDHGWHLGDHDLWGKVTNFEVAARAPLLISVPGLAGGRKVRALTEFLDIYPTVCDAAGQPLPSHLQGESLLPLLKDPALPGKAAAFTQLDKGQTMGYSIRTDRWRYTEWRSQTGKAVRARELYDHLNDPEENNNLVPDRGQRRQVTALAGRLNRAVAGWKPESAESPPQKPKKIAPRPNVLLIVSEDNGPHLGCYGDAFARTPHLDTLAVSGVRFRNAFVTHPVCSSSRSSILTGLYPHQNGQIGLATHRYAMFRSFPNIASQLKGRGYRTGLIGKLHVNPESAFPFDFRWNDPKHISFNHRDVRKIATIASEFFRSTLEPFFLMVNYPDAHFPLLRQQNGLPPESLKGSDVTTLPLIAADSPRLREGTAAYYDCLSRLDTGIGMLLDELRASGRDRDTVVLYVGDHGPQFSRGKCTLYEGGLRVPLLVRWPGRTKTGLVRDELVSTVDLLPTILDVVKSPVPAGLAGRSLLPLLKGEKVAWREYLFAERTTYSARTFFPQRSVRDQRYKLILNLVTNRANPVAEAYLQQRGAFFNFATTADEIRESTPSVRQSYARWRTPPRIEMYDLQEDPQELNDLGGDAGLEPTRKRLLRALSLWQEETGDLLADPAILARLDEEHRRVAESYPKLGYRRDKSFSWKYLDYMKPGVPEGNRE